MGLYKYSRYNQTIRNPRHLQKTSQSKLLGNSAMGISVFILTVLAEPIQSIIFRCGSISEKLYDDSREAFDILVQGRDRKINFHCATRIVERDSLR